MALITAFSQGCSSDKQTADLPQVELPPLKVGYSISIEGEKFSLESLKYAKSVGVDYVEVSGIGLFLDSNRNFKMTDTEITQKLKWAKKNADEAGIEIWSIHMPFGKNIDLSLIDENDRTDVVYKQGKLIELLSILQPKIILFHPSYYLGLNERELRITQLIKSANTLNDKVKAINAVMVIENMLGPELLKDLNQERPLLRNVEEVVDVMNRLPKSIGSALDMNHIKKPEKLILAMGSRLKSVHIADGSGEAENHYFPCSGKGANNWSLILDALDEVNFQGPFLFESAYDDEKDLLKCYTLLHKNYIKTKNK
ncbi:sugar phosphate isomerase/epimerase family protein [Gelidibacter salicanalis]|uniref:Sugar phosphate isomerase/epimerase n=1 Tax=Gelidibacter salicanalis TaxID=291193 RepID=A0A934NK22_9FLAO|nr:sugar phosphate isomerase/epimerase family protein [Gelidibacter salicanalis]MBJ7882479.1 sugar phosphate isomerase/epimerase [Gelidibacter salicanalis]